MSLILLLIEDTRHSLFSYSFLVVDESDGWPFTVATVSLSFKYRNIRVSHCTPYVQCFWCPVRAAGNPNKV
jgi:hypothetical protein